MLGAAVLRLPALDRLRLRERRLMDRVILGDLEASAWANLRSMGFRSITALVLKPDDVDDDGGIGFGGGDGSLAGGNRGSLPFSSSELSADLEGLFSLSGEPYL